MKNWIISHKKSIILSVLVTLLPMVAGLILWNELPDTMLIHWGSGGNADGTGSKDFVVFGVPLIFAALDLLGLMATGFDKKAREQKSKGMEILFWLLPVVSCACSALMYAASMGKAMGVAVIVPLMLGVLFVVIGNFMPKVKQNSSMGIKCIWTLSNEENWNKTHRLAGKVWVASGVVLLISALFPFAWALILSVVVAVLAGVVPMVYSYRIYKAHKAQGVEYFTKETAKEDKKRTTVAVVMSSVVLVIVAVLMFTGDISYTVGEDALQIEAGWSEDISVAYDRIDELLLREDFDFGMRMIGFSSARLSTGTFQNGELGGYTLYAYNSCKTAILIRSGDAWLAINASTEEETLQLYQALLEKIS